MATSEDGKRPRPASWNASKLAFAFSTSSAAALRAFSRRSLRVRSRQRRSLPAICLGLVLLAPVAGLGDPATVVESKFEFFVTDVEEDIRFYTALGFLVAHRNPGGYTTLLNDGTVVALSPVPGWLPLRWLGFLRHPPLGTELVFYTDGLEELRAELEAAGYGPGAIAPQPWGDRDFRVTDPEGYYIRVSEGRAVPVAEVAP